MSRAKVVRPTSILQSPSPQVKANVKVPCEDGTGPSECAVTGIQAVFLVGLSVDDVEIVEPIRIQTEHGGEDNYLATVCEANLNASGDTEEEAIANLQDIIVGTHHLLMSISSGRLGPDLLHQREFLKFHLR